MKAFLKNILDWLKSHNIYSKKFYKSHGKIKRWLAVFFTSFISVILIVVVAAFCVFNSYMSKLDRGQIDHEDLDVTHEAEQTYSGITNIMLYGVDSRNMKEVSRSDAIILLTIDKDNNKIKMTSIARDSYVEIDGYGKDKINHAYAFGWAKTKDVAGGAALSLKTVNNAFKLNVTDYVTANFWALTKIIDYIGGIEIEVNEAERLHINSAREDMLQMGFDCPPIAASGLQQLNGAQAVLYSRERTIGGVVERGNRQRKVLAAMLSKTKSLSPVKYPGLISLVLGECSTSLSNSDLLSLGTWAAANFSSIEIENLSIPTAEMNRGSMINGVYYDVYDLDKAAKMIEEFILEPKKANTLESK